MKWKKCKNCKCMYTDDEDRKWCNNEDGKYKCIYLEAKK